MQIKARTLLVIVMLCLVVGFLAAPGIAAEGVPTNVALPRAFQSAQLGMTLSAFTAVVPEAKRASLGGRDQMNVQWWFHQRIGLSNALNIVSTMIGSEK